MTDGPKGTVLMHQIGSVAIQAAGYDHVQRALVIHFTGGNRYAVYSDVPIDVWHDFMNAISKGRYFNTYIKGLYPSATAEVEPLPPEA